MSITHNRHKIGRGRRAISIIEGVLDSVYEYERMKGLSNVKGNLMKLCIADLLIVLENNGRVGGRGRSYLLEE